MATRRRKRSSRDRRYRVTADQSRIMFDEVERLHRNFVEMWRTCANRRCRRSRQCLGCPSFPCTGGRVMGHRSRRQNQRLISLFFRSPPPDFGTLATR